GILPLQHHDPSAVVEARRMLAACRVHAGDETNEAPGRDTYGDVQGGLLWRVTGTERGGMHSWWFTGPAEVYDGTDAAGGGEGSAGTGTAPAPAPAPGGETQNQVGSVVTAFSSPGATNQSQPAGAASGPGTAPPAAAADAGGWRPLRSDKDPDKRYDAVKLTGHPQIKQVYPKGWTGTVSAATEETEQREVFHPDFLGLVAPARAGNPTAGTPVFDLTTEGELDPKNFARLQSLLSVEKVSGLGGLSGSVLALQSGVSPRDGTCGRL